VLCEQFRSDWQRRLSISRGLEVVVDNTPCSIELCIPGEGHHATNRVLIEVNSHNEKLAEAELTSGRAYAAITTDEKLFSKHRSKENWFYLPPSLEIQSENWVEEREHVTTRNQLNSESYGLTTEVVFREIERIILYGLKKYIPTSEEKILSLIEENFSDKPKRPYTSFIKSKSNRDILLAEDFFPDQFQDLEEFQKRLKGLPPFFLHYGGAGDALLLLASIIDRFKPEPGSLTILSAATSIEASKIFFREFPAVGDLYICQIPDDSMALTILRYATCVVANCKGQGATPLRSHKEDWIPGLDITKSYSIPLYPEWAKNFPKKIFADNQIAVAPRGSEIHMTGGKSNSIPQVLWEDVIFLIKSAGYLPVILGVPSEEEDYPAPSGCIVKRSLSFREQMEIINGSVALVGADSWAKTFSALAGKPTLVFPPTYDGIFNSSDDASYNVFLRPWSNITLAKSTQDLQSFLLSKLF